MFQERVNTNISDHLAALHLRSDHWPSVTMPLEVQIREPYYAVSLIMRTSTLLTKLDFALYSHIQVLCWY